MRPACKQWSLPNYSDLLCYLLCSNLQRAIDLSAVVVDPETELHEILIQQDYDPLESEAGEPEAMWMDDYLMRIREAVMESYRRGSVTGFQVPGVKA